MQQTNTNVAPFYDDYDASKSYHRIMFKAGRSVQTRELNQLQTILQEQIERFGDGIYSDGSLVVPGGVSINTNQPSVGITLTGNALWTDITSVTSQLYLISKGTGLLAKIPKYYAVSGSDPICFLLEYQNSGSGGSSSSFVTNEAVGVIYYDADGNAITVANANVSQVGTAIWAKILSGIYFARGFFVEAEDQNIVLSKFDNTVSGRIGFDVTESIVDETIDASLYSNATGTPNYKAAGAGRLKISLTANSYALTATPSNFIELARVEGGTVAKQVTTSTYSILADVLAQRTFEESGNYTVDSFGLEVKEHLKSDTSNGVYTAAEGGSADKFVAQMKPGIAYVKGYRVENTGVVNVAVDKARDTALANNAVIAADYGPYIVVQNMYSLPTLDLTSVYQLQDSTQTQIGACSVRAARLEGTNTYRLYLFNLSFNTGKTINNASRIYFNDASNLFHGDLVSSVLFDGSIDGLIFQLPYDSIETLKPSGTTDTSYSVLRAFNLTTDSSGNASVTLASNEVFSAFNNFEFMIGYTGTANTGNIIDPTGVITFAGSPTGRQMTLALGSGNGSKSIKVIAPVIKQAPAEKSKTLTTTSESFTMSGVAVQALANSDILDIISVTETLPNQAGTADVTSSFTFDNGQRDDWYQNGILKTIGGVVVTKVLTIEYRYFAHSSGDYFSVDSYGGIDRSLIPTYTKSDGSAQFDLSDCIDFRPTKDASGNFTSVTIVGEIIKPGDNIRADINYYLPRIDSVYVDADGNFGVTKGIASDTPVALAVPDNAMKLYELSIPAYTSSITGIAANYVENKRYTMRDIGALETRIENLEYYTTLSQLESDTSQIQILDSATGNNRYKNGFAVDGFSSYSLGNPSDSQWDASIDTTNKELEAGFAANVIDIGFVSGSNFVQTGDIFSLPYNSVSVISQKDASTTQVANPFSFSSWIGTLHLSPNLDYFTDVGFLPYGREDALPDSYVDTDNVTQYYPTGYYDAYWYKNLASSLSTANSSFYYFYGQWEAADWYLTNGYKPFMRSRTIAFKARNMKPSARVYAFINGVDVTAFCTQDSGTAGTLVTDATGYISGSLVIPNQETLYFAAGTAVVRLCDSATNDDTAIQTVAEGNYYSGYSFAQNTATRVTGMTRKAKSIATSVQDIRQRSEVAQLFYGSASYLTSVGLYFSAKDATLPISVQIRPVENGYPTATVMPFGTAMVLPGAVTTSTDASVETRFVFDSPIFLESSKQYALVLVTDSPTYAVHVGELGSVNYAGANISKQAQVGSFAKSVDNSTWVSDNTKNLAFNTYVASFTATSGSVVFGNKAIQNLRPLSFNAIKTVNGSSTLVATIPSHGMISGDTFTIQNATGSNNIAATDLNATHTATAVTLDTVTFSVASTADSDGTTGGSNMAATVNYPFARFFANFETVKLPGTAIKWEYAYKQQSNRQVQSYVEFDPTSTQTLDSQAVAIAAGDLSFRVTLTTTNTVASPMIDLTGMSALLLDMRSNTDTTSPAFAYVTKSIKFDNPSTSARFYVSAKMPGSSTIALYYKLILAPSDDLTTKTWTALSPTKPVVNDAKNFNEYEFDLDGVGSFIGYQLMVAGYASDSTSTPTLSSLRSIALA